MNRIRDTREAVVLLTLLRQQHNLENPDAPVYGRDVAEYLGLRSKSTIVNYESGHSHPSNAMLSKWLEFWGLGLFVGPIEEVEDDEDDHDL